MVLMVSLSTIWRCVIFSMLSEKYALNTAFFRRTALHILICYCLVVIKDTPAEVVKLSFAMKRRGCPFFVIFISSNSNYITMESTMNVVVSAFEAKISALKSLLTSEQLKAYDAILIQKKELFQTLNPQLPASQQEIVDLLFR